MAEALQEVRPGRPAGEQDLGGEADLPAEQPIHFWPEGAVAIAAVLALAVIGFRHRHYLGRKVCEAQRAVDEFQRQGGLEELRQVAQQATEFLRGSDGR